MKDLNIERTSRTNLSMLQPSYSEDTKPRSLSTMRSNSRYLNPPNDNKRLEMFLNELFSL